MGDRTKLAIVTGAAQGIGRAIAARLCADGASVVLVDRDAAMLAETLDDLVADGNVAYSVAADLADARAAAEAFGQIERLHGAADILVNNVGQSAREKASEFWCAEEGVAESVVNISLMATLTCSRFVVPGMRARGSGKIINISSEAALIGAQSGTFYSAAKAGVIGFTRSLARELAPYHVNVNVVAPGYTRTQAISRLPKAVVERALAEIPLGYMGAPEDIAYAVSFFASEASRFITGQTLLVNGGRWMN